MKESKRNPDSIVFDQGTQKFDAFLKRYPTSLSSPPISDGGISLSNERAISQANHKFKKRAQEIREQIEILMREFDENELVWGSQIGFEPQIGMEIYLYENKTGKRFASLISPDEWKNDFIFYGHFKLDSDFSWKKLDYGKH